MLELYVYYRVAATNQEQAQREVQRFQKQLAERHQGLQSRLLRRPEEEDGLQTWMEVYTRPDSSDGISQNLQADIEQAATVLKTLISGPRHQEIFQSV